MKRFPWDEGYARSPLNPTLYLGRQCSASELIKHMSLYYSDWHIVNDLDCVLGECATGEDQEAVKNYARARRGGPGFNSRFCRSNNHRDLNPTERVPVNRRPVGRPKGNKVKCEFCGVEFQAKRVTARFCSTAHRMAAFRVAA